MEFARLQRNWENLGRRDPMWAILTRPGTEGGRWNEEEFFRTGRELVTWLGAWCGLHGIALPGGRALDFGCGVGRVTQALAPYFESVTGVDVSEPMVELAWAKNRFPGRVRYVCNTKPDLRVFDDASFDAAISVIVLQHMRPEYAVAYVRELLRVLRPGGLLFFQEATGVCEGQVVPEPPVETPGEAHMEMHAVSEKVLGAAISIAGGKIELAEPDMWAGPGWQSMHFAVRRLAL